MPVGYALFAMALGICAGTLLRRTVPALAVTLAGFVALRVLIAQWLRPHYMTPVTVYYKLTAPVHARQGSYLAVSQGIVGPNGKPRRSASAATSFNGSPVPAVCAEGQPRTPATPAWRRTATGHTWPTSRASRFWAFQGIETGIYVVLAAVLLGITFWVLKRRDA